MRTNVDCTSGEPEGHRRAWSFLFSLMEFGVTTPMVAVTPSAQETVEAKREVRSQLFEGEESVAASRGERKTRWKV